MMQGRLWGFGSLLLLVCPMLYANSYVCETRFVISTPQTVSFYYDKVSPLTFLGTGTAGKWINNYATCIPNQKIIALTWGIQNNGSTQVLKQYQYKTKQTYYNKNALAIVQFPRDFKDAPYNRQTVICHARIMNNTAKKVTFFGGKVAKDTILGTAQPWKLFNANVPCFASTPILAQIYEHQGDDLSNKKVTVYNYETKYMTTSVNNYNLLATFPKDFDQKATKTYGLLDTIIGYIKPDDGVDTDPDETDDVS